MVQRGDTLSAIAARLGVSVDALAAANGLDPSGLLIAGTTLHAVGGSGTQRIGRRRRRVRAAAGATWSSAATR